MTTVTTSNVKHMKNAMANVFPVALRSGSETEVIVSKQNGSYTIKAGKGNVVTKLGTAEINFLVGAEFMCLESVAIALETAIFVPDIQVATK